jgi:hypothetical protein
MIVYHTILAKARAPHGAQLIKPRVLKGVDSFLRTIDDMSHISERT